MKYFISIFIFIFFQGCINQKELDLAVMKIQLGTISTQSKVDNNAKVLYNKIQSLENYTKREIRYIKIKDEEDRLNNKLFQTSQLEKSIEISRSILLLSKSIQDLTKNTNQEFINIDKQIDLMLSKNKEEITTLKYNTEKSYEKLEKLINKQLQELIMEREIISNQNLNNSINKENIKLLQEQINELYNLKKNLVVIYENHGTVNIEQNKE